MKNRKKLTHTISTTSTTSTTSFTRINFSVGNVTKKEKKSIIKDIKQFMIGEPQFGGITEVNLVDLQCPHYKTFSVFYNSTNDQKEISKLFFKLKLRFPKFEIHAKEITYSFRT